MEKQFSEMTLEELWQLFPIILKDHNSDYCRWYNEENESIIKVISPQEIKRISHIGSSAIKGLISKPTIDILLEIDSKCNVEELKSILINNGWILMSDKEEPYLMLAFNKGYTPFGFAEKVYHLHVRYFGNWNELYFRDYLLAHEDIAIEYGKLKLSLLEKYKHNRDGYTEAKTDFVMKYSEKARDEFNNRYKP